MIRPVIVVTNGDIGFGLHCQQESSSHLMVEKANSAARHLVYTYRTHPDKYFERTFSEVSIKITNEDM